MFGVVITAYVFGIRGRNRGDRAVPAVAEAGLAAIVSRAHRVFHFIEERGIFDIGVSVRARICEGVVVVLAQRDTRGPVQVSAPDEKENQHNCANHNYPTKSTTESSAQLLLCSVIASARTCTSDESIVEKHSAVRVLVVLKFYGDAVVFVLQPLNVVKCSVIRGQTRFGRIVGGPDKPVDSLVIIIEGGRNVQCQAVVVHHV